MTGVETDPLVLVAEAAGAFGVAGEVRLTTFTEEPANLLAYGPLLDEFGAARLTLLSGRAHKGGFVALAKEVATREGAAALRGLRLHVRRSALPAPADDEFYLADLIGLAAVSPCGEALGRIKSVQDFGAGDLLEVAPEDGPSWWAPFTREAAPDVRLADGVVVVVPPAEA
ncbi:MAG: ribosome maturation factor RimM [Caulobacteraceae bacterium]